MLPATAVLAMAQDDSHRLNLYVTSTLLAAIDEWRRQEKDIPTRSEAARRLIAQAIKDSGRLVSAKTKKPD